jgi:putative peptide zinc metalloprotease protein
MARKIFSSSWHNVAKLQPLLLPHCHMVRHIYRGQPWYVIQDDTGSGHYRLTPAAHALVSRMDGTRSVETLWNESCESGATDIPTQDELV